MCWCNKNLRTPCCGGVDCVPPKGSVISNNTIPNLSKTKRYFDTSYKSDIELFEDSVIITRHRVNAQGNDVGFSESMVFDSTEFKMMLIDLLGDYFERYV